MKTLAAICVRRPVFTWSLAIALIVLGLASFGKLPVERYPNIDIPYVSVSIEAPGLSAVQVESEISTRVENALGTVSGLERIDSTSQEGASIVFASFVLSKDGNVAAQDVRDRVSRLGGELPLTTKPPQIETFNINAAPILVLALKSDATKKNGRSLRELTEIADTEVRRELQGIKGIGTVRLVGGAKRTHYVDLDAAKLLAHGLTADEVRSALAREDIEAPGGDVPDGARSLSLRLSAKARTTEELAKTVVAQRSGLAVRLSDVGRVDDGDAVSESLALFSGTPAVVISVLKQSGANTVEVADEAKARIAQLGERLPPGVSLSVVRDDSTAVKASLEAVQEHLVIGAILAALVVLLFLRSGRATVIAALAIPSSVVGTFAVAQALGLSLNMMTLLGLTLAVGIVIDDAIVVLENVIRVLRAGSLSPAEAAVEATREIGLAVLATTLSLVAVFLPVAFMSGIVGRYLAPFGLTMTISILLSMGIAFTLTPMLCARWLKRDGLPKDHEAPSYGERAHGEEAHGWLESAYVKLLAFALRRRWLVGIGIVVTLGSMVPIASVLPMNFLPVEDEARFEIYTRLSEGTATAQTALLTERLAARVRTIDGVESTLVTVADARGAHEATIFVTLTRRGIQDPIMKRVRDELAPKVLPKDSLTMVSSALDFGGSGPDGAAIQYVIRGPELDELERIGTQLLAEARKIPGTVDHGITLAGRPRELSISVDRAKASELGVSHSDIAGALFLASRKGALLGTMRDPHSAVEVSNEVRLRVDTSDGSAEDAVRSLTVRSSSGRLVPLAELAEMKVENGPAPIRRVKRQRQVTLFMNTLPGTSDQAVVNQLNTAIAHVDKPPQYVGEVLGNAQEMEKAMNAFLLAIVLSFAFMYLVLAAQFESWIHPVTILVSLPLSVPFGLLALKLGGQSLNLFSALGFLVLFGIVKKNAILQVDHTLALRREGLGRTEAILLANSHRLRPILMTTLAFVAGMIPLVVSSGAGASTNRAIAVGIMGGQTLSLLLTLVATPVVYTWFDDLGGLFGRLRVKLGALTAPLGRRSRA